MLLIITFSHKNDQVDLLGITENVYCWSLLNLLDILDLPSVGKEQVLNHEGWLELGGKERESGESKAFGLAR